MTTTESKRVLDRIIKENYPLPWEERAQMARLDRLFKKMAVEGLREDLNGYNDVTIILKRMEIKAMPCKGKKGKGKRGGKGKRMPYGKKKK